MLNIVIVDDQEEIVKLLVSYISSYFNQRKIDYTMQSHTSVNEFLNTNVENIDILLLDIEMSELNGIDAALEIRKKNKNACICFITGYNKYISDAYRIHAFDYILKPISVDKIVNLFNEIIEYMNFEKEKIIIKEYMTTVGKIKISTADIIYFEYIDKSSEYLNRSTKLITHNEVFVIKDNISNVYTSLDDDFASPHRSFIVNFKNIKVIKKNEIIMINNDVIPLSQKKRKMIQIAFNKYVNEYLANAYD